MVQVTKHGRCNNKQTQNDKRPRTLKIIQLVIFRSGALGAHGTRRVPGVRCEKLGCSGALLGVFGGRSIFKIDLLWCEIESCSDGGERDGARKESHSGSRNDLAR